MQGSCYKLFTKAKSWNSAKSACEALGAKLVVLNSLAENQAVGEKITGGQGTYIGLYRSPKDKSRWLWLDQSRATHTHWVSGEPNNFRGSEDCVHMRSKSSGYEWNDLPCNTDVYHIPYVCETSDKSGSVILYIAFVQPKARAKRSQHISTTYPNIAAPTFASSG